MSLVVCMYYALPIFVDHLVGAARGSFAMSLDTQTTLRLAVSHRLETRKGNGSGSPYDQSSQGGVGGLYSPAG